MCTIRCGRCKDGQACDKHNGFCYNGCVANFQQPKCEGNCYDHFIFDFFSGYSIKALFMVALLSFKNQCKCNFYNIVFFKKKLFDFAGCFINANTLFLKLKCVKMVSTTQTVPEDVVIARMDKRVIRKMEIV